MKYMLTALLFILSVGQSFAESVFLEDLTWPEVRKKILSGHTTIIVPSGGTEQNGPHMILGKHNYIIKHTSEKIAEKLGNALVAPVITYVPQGNISPPEGHMTFPGTISVSSQTFGQILEDTAYSMKQHGFRNIVLMGDSGGNQEVQAMVAERLSRKWAADGVQVIHLSEYYRENGQPQYLLSLGVEQDQLYKHAGIEDTSELLAVHPEGIRNKMRGNYTNVDYRKSGATGDATRATPQLGQQLLELKINAAVDAIQRTTNLNAMIR